MIREAVLQASNLSREAVQGNIADSFSRENKGRFKRVEGTHKERARGIRAVVKAAWGRTSRMRTPLLVNICLREEGRTGVNGGGGGETDMDIFDIDGRRMVGTDVLGDFSGSKRAVRRGPLEPKREAMA
jgi:hypothetical protein